jgi:Flp pilus assembly protein TadD
LPAEHHPEMLRGVARTYLVEDHVDGAVTTLQRALELEPDDQETLVLLVDVLVASGRDAEAQPYMAKLPAGAGVDPVTFLNLGIKRYNEGDLEGAMQQFQRVVAEHPETAIAYFYRGLAHLALEKPAEAKADFEKFIALEPEHPKAAEAREFLASM